MWLEDILSFLINKHPKKLSDQECLHAEYKLITYANKSKELNSLRNHYYEINNDNSDKDLDVHLLRGIKKRCKMMLIMHSMYEIIKKATKHQKIEILNILNNTDDL